MNNYLYRLLLILRMIAMIVPLFIIVVEAMPEATIRFFDSATINDTVINLGDISDISSENSELKRELNEKKLMKSAPPGNALLISTEKLVSYHLRNELQNKRIAIGNHKRITVKTASIEKSVSDYNNLIINYLRENVSWDPDEWKVEIGNCSHAWKCYNAPIIAKIQGVFHKRPRGALRLQLLITQYEKTQTVPLSCYISVNTKVLIASRDIARGSILGPDDVEKKKSDISRLGPDPFYAVENIDGKKAVRTIKAGTILTERMLARLPDVAKGDNLSINISKGNVKISIRGTARENGFIGEKIWVENSVTNKLIRVVVKDKSSAQLLL